MEHIVPESLGNWEHTLSPGVVCDKCNQYFSRKVEKPVLCSGMFRLLGASRRVPSKKKKIPDIPCRSECNVPEHRAMGRFLGKIGLEAFLFKVRNLENWNYMVVNNPFFDPLREYVRFGQGEGWPFFFRPLYPVNAVFHEGKQYYEVLHEYDVLWTDKDEIFFVVCIHGAEFILNMGERDLSGILEWLRDNSYRSPLYTGKNAEQTN